MREILFRGKRIDKGDWVEGSLVVAGDYCCILPADENSVHPTEYPYLNPEIGTIDGHLFPADPSTVGQFTGLTDKNGKKIFEGDILFCTREIGMGYREFCGKVVYKAPKFYVDCGNTVLPLDCDNEKPDFTIIGNIYDNPELLEEK